MLVLTRKPGQTIRVGDDVEIVVVEVRGDQVRLGIRAPSDVSIVRGEIPDEIQRENRAAAEAGDGSDTAATTELAEEVQGYSSRSDTT